MAEHKTQLKSGRMRGYWFGACTCGWESAQVPAREEAERYRYVHDLLNGNIALSPLALRTLREILQGAHPASPTGLKDLELAGLVTGYRGELTDAGREYVTRSRAGLDILPSCEPLARELERLCPGILFLTVTEDRVRIWMPTRWMATSMTAGHNVPSGYRVDTVELPYEGADAETYLREEIRRRTPARLAAEGSPDFIRRDAETGEPLEGPYHEPLA